MNGERGDEEGARLLLFAVLTQALAAATDRRHPDPDAARWFHDPRAADDPFSFRWVCAALGLSPRRIAADLPGCAARLLAARRDPRKPRKPCPPRRAYHRRAPPAH